ncbi:MAG: hypothetical protein B0A82_26975 [Alkalinema sp. CACIAM 70d]|nr:MAG: hypothetical protein B0A82_26975 [Alkalinema sp. CACIAM 70d]
MSSSSFEEELRQQVEQERLINQVTTLIRQSLELPVILETAVQEVRKLLKADRLIIYQFNIAAPACPVDFDQLTTAVPITVPQLDGITYESRAHDRIPSVLHRIEDGWQLPATELRNKYQSGQSCSITDTSNSANTSVYFLPLGSDSVRSELVTPILVQGNLWGLLIAHQCEHPRQWLTQDCACLERLADNLAIAIHQASLYAELQQQKATLEQQVIERTQHLRDALYAAQSADQAKSEFLATMSHELRTPLTCVIGMAATLLRQTPETPLPPEKQKAYLQIIRDRGEHLLLLINDMLELSRLETGRTILDIREFSLFDLASQTLRQLQDQAQKKQIMLFLKCTNGANGDKAPRFLADPRRVQQILLNLLSNAVKFTPDGGTVTLRVWQTADIATLQVEDTGIGIPEDQRPLLFQKFQQLDPSHRRNYEGTGLGLALTKRLVELHDGSISVTSKVGEGSTFTVQLPSQVRSALDYVRSQEQPLPVLHQRILLIESDEEMAHVVCDLLNPAEYQVVWMTETDLAKQNFQILQPHAVIIAGSMLLEFWSWLVQEATALPPLLVISLGDGDHHRADLSLMGLSTDILVQPISQPDAFIDRVASLITRE